MKVSAHGRWLFVVGTLAVVGVLIVGVWFYRAQERQARRTAEQRLETVAELKVKEIAAWRAELLASAASAAADPVAAAAASHWLRAPDDAGRTALLGWLRARVAGGRFDDVLLLDRAGRVVLSAGGRHPAVEDETVRAAAEARRSRRPLMLDLHTSPDGGPPHLGALAPVSDPDRPEAEPVGVVVLVCHAERRLFPLVQSWPGPERTAETVLVRRSGDSVLFLNNLRFEPDAALKMRLPLTRTDLPAVMAVTGREGVVDGRDYRGEPVLAVLRQVPQANWFMVAKVDTAEVYESWRARAVLIIALFVSLAAVLAGLTALIWQSSRRLHYQALFQAESALRQSEQRFRTTLMSVGDGVIATDAEGRVQLLNPVAEALCGWSQEEARGRPLEDVFTIVNEETRQTVENPVRRVVREGRVIGLANHTLLVSRDGTERAIADSGAPIRERDELVGVVLVFRDQSEERAAQRALAASEERHRLLFDNSTAGIGVHQPVFDDSGEPIDYVYVAVNPAFESHTGLRAAEVIGRPVTEVVPDFQKTPFARVFRQVVLTGEPVSVEDWSEPFGRWYEINAYRVDGGNVAVIFRDVTERKEAAAEQARLQTQLAKAQRMEAIGQLAGGVAHDFNNMLVVITGNAEMALDELDDAAPVRRELTQILEAARRSADLTRQLLAFARRQSANPQVLDLNDTVSGMLKMLGRLIGEDLELRWQPVAEVWRVNMDPAQLDQILANLVVNARDAIDGQGAITLATENVVFDDAYCADHPGFVPGEFVFLSVSDTGCGMSPETLERLFEPFFTTKELGSGTGLGLATVYGVVKQNDGFINVYSEPGLGSTFKIYLPRHRGAEEPAAETAVEPPRTGTETVLLVEDEPAILHLTARVLTHLGYTVLAAASPVEALALADEHGERLDLLVTDVVMPAMTGKELADRLLAAYPGLKVLYMSGYTADVIGRRGVLDEGVQFIQKPFPVSGLGAKIRETLDQS